jgi:hypothetical protein
MQCFPVSVAKSCLEIWLNSSPASGRCHLGSGRARAQEAPLAREVACWLSYFASASSGTDRPALPEPPPGASKVDVAVELAAVSPIAQQEVGSYLASRRDDTFASVGPGTGRRTTFSFFPRAPAARLQLGTVARGLRRPGVHLTNLVGGAQHGRARVRRDHQLESRQQTHALPRRSILCYANTILEHRRRSA